MEYFWVALGGAGGAVVRMAVSRLSLAMWGSWLPWGTLLVNVSGCLLLGILNAWLLPRALPPQYRFMLTAGFLGALTTFSTLTNETVMMLRAGSLAKAIGYPVISLVLGFGGLLLGQWLGELISQH